MCEKVSKRNSKTISKDVNIVTYIPQDDYISKITGVYYHFGKMEWRSICHDPINYSKRWQKTFSIRKYGFYSAKKLAELTTVKNLKESKHTSKTKLFKLKNVYKNTTPKICLTNIPNEIPYIRIDCLNNFTKIQYLESTNMYETDISNITDRYKLYDTDARHNECNPRYKMTNTYKYLPTEEEHFSKKTKNGNKSHSFYGNLPESWNMHNLHNVM